MTEPHRVRLEIAGRRIALELGEGLEDLAAALPELWAPLLAAEQADGADDEQLVLTATGALDREGAVRLLPGPSAAYELSGIVTRRVLQSLLGRRILLHAGAVVHPHLGTVLLVGPSGAGKSTATTVLARGGGYLSDELAILDPDSFAVTAYPKPVSRVDPALPGHVKRDHALEELGLEACDGADAPAHVLLLRRRADGEDLPDTVHRAPLHEALVAIAEQSSSLWKVPGGLRRLARLLEDCGGALVVRYREASAIAELVERAPAATAEPWDPIDPAEHVPDIGTVQVVRFADAIATADGVVVLAEGRVVHLPGLVGLVWEVLCESGGLPPEQLEAEAVARIGAHPRSREIVDAALTELLSSGWAREVPRP